MNNFLLPIVSSLYGVKQPENISLTKEQFGQWFSGFVDGEGNFQVFFDRHYVRVLFRIVLHIDDIQTLYKIKDFLEIGNVHTNGNRCIYSIGKVQDLNNILIPLLDKNTLLTTKYLDYLDFKKVVNLLLCSKSSSSKDLGSDLTIVKDIIAQMNSSRTTYNYALIPSIIINPFWLLGFIEAEGTFGFKNLVPYFQLGQHARNLIVLENIIKYLESLSKGFVFSNFNTKLKLSKTLHKNTNVYVIVLSNIDALHDYLTPFLLTMSFQTRKNLDFFYWSLALHLFKFGYFYVAEGRSLVKDISNSINTARYSNKNVSNLLPNIDSINKVLSINLPVKLTADMNHLILSQSFARLVTLRQVWIYDNGQLVIGSPFSSYAEAQVAIGLPRNSVAIRRNIDTDKLYLKRYSFYSNKQ